MISLYIKKHFYQYEVYKFIKTISFLTFFSIALPRWIGYIIYSSINHTLEFALLDNLLIIAFILSSIIFSVAQIFEYGTMLQNENDEIL